jgi:hypothetical protein
MFCEYQYADTESGYMVTITMLMLDEVWMPFDLSEVLQPGLIKLIDLQENPVLLDGDQ